MRDTSKMRIMVIDDNITNLNLARMALEEQYKVVLVPSGEKAIELFTRMIPALILLDVEMPGMSGFEVIRHIKQAPPPLCMVPVIFVTAKDDSASEIDGLNLGAVDYITKPFSFPMLLKRVELHLQLQQYSRNLENMVMEKTKVIAELQFSIVHVLADMVERRDGSTGGHLLRTQNYLAMLLEEVHKLGLHSDQLQKADEQLYIYASQLHDVGKMSIPDSILFKPGRLTPKEFEVMKTHTVLGEEAIRDAMSSVQETKFLEMAASFAGSHHEWWDGSGYPKGLKGTEIPIEGRLMAIVDVYDALISQRPYKSALSHEAAVEMILGECATHFDPVLIAAFERVAEAFQGIARTYSAAPLLAGLDGRE